PSGVHPEGRSEGNTSRGRVQSAQHQRRRTCTSARCADESHHTNLERNAGRHGRRRSLSRSFLWHWSRVLLNLQSLYELRMAQEKAGKTIRNLPTLKTTRATPCLNCDRFCRPQP